MEKVFPLNGYPIIHHHVHPAASFHISTNVAGTKSIVCGQVRYCLPFSKIRVLQPPSPPSTEV